MIDSKDRAAADAPANPASDTKDSADAHGSSALGSDDGKAAKAAKAPVPERYRHFKHLPPRSHQWIEKNCGTWVLDAMRNYLLDPDRVFPDWGTRFAVTLKDIGRDEVERMGEAEVLYDYVMTSPFWEINYQIRKRLMASKPQRKRKPAGRGKSSGKSRSGDRPTKADTQADTQAETQAKQEAKQEAQHQAQQEAQHQAQPEQSPVMAEPEPTTPVKS